MYIVKGICKLKIESIVIEGLFNLYDYNIKLNDDLNFIYGKNGCGKTTILNIIGDILKGDFLSLLKYEFTKVTISYFDTLKENRLKKLKITKSDELLIIFDGMEYSFSDIIIYYNIESNFKTPKYYQEENVLKELQNKIIQEFNYDYLPLNRELLFNINENFLGYEEEKVESYLTEIKNGIKTKYIDYITERYEYDNMLKNILINSLLDNTFNIEDLYNKIKRTDLDTIIKELQLTIDNFYIRENKKNDYIETVNKILNKQIPRKNTELNNLVLELYRIYDIYEKYNEYKKNNIKKINDLEKYINIINDFIYDDETGKKIAINKYGDIGFLTKCNSNQVDIEKLSSGEKQLLIIFYKLIFNYKNGILTFIIDEPEISLHLIWQRVFIDKVLQSRQDIQVLIATHSPEIINRYRHKMVRLVNKRKY